MVGRLTVVVMTKSKKTTKKSDLSRAAIEERIDDIVSSLRDINTYELSPNDVDQSITDVMESLEQLASEVRDEQY